MDAPFAVQFHVYTVVPAALLGAWMLAARKGNVIHRLLGRLWVLLMAATAISAFFIHEIRLIGSFSPIHLLSILTLISCVGIVWSARTRRLQAHKRMVTGLYFGGIGLAGLFTLLPGRIMHRVVFGEGMAGLPLDWTLGLIGAAFLAWWVWRKSRRSAAV